MNRLINRSELEGIGVLLSRNTFFGWSSSLAVPSTFSSASASELSQGRQCQTGCKHNWIQTSGGARETNFLFGASCSCALADLRRSRSFVGERIGGSGFFVKHSCKTSEGKKLTVMAPASVRTRRASCSTIDDSTMSIGSLSSDLWQEVEREQGKHNSGGGGGGGDDNEKELVKYRDPVAPRSRRTVRRSVSVAEEASSDGSRRGAALSAWSALRSSPSFEVLHPLQTLRLEREAELSRNPVQNTLDQPQSAKVNEEIAEAGREEESDEASKENLQLAIVPVAPANVVVIIVDAERKPTTGALDWALKVVIRPGDEVVILGVLKHIHSPST